MIHVPRDETAIDLVWRQRAEEFLSELKKLKTHAERMALIALHDDEWGKLKKTLLGFSHGKCWYSEAKELCSDYHVDHFRPKGRAKNLDDTERDGYWWLAFNWRNYRIAGSVCNSPHRDTTGVPRGKHDYFPLRNGCPAAACPEDDLRNEAAYLLDPADPDDPLLLTFDETGEPVPEMPKGTWAHERAAVTKSVLHLDYPPLVDERKKVWEKARRKLSEAQRLMSAPETAAGGAHRQEVKTVLKELREMVASETELAGTARACLAKSNVGWAVRLVAEAK